MYCQGFGRERLDAEKLALELWPGLVAEAAERGVKGCAGFGHWGLHGTRMEEPQRDTVLCWCGHGWDIELLREVCAADFVHQTPPVSLPTAPGCPLWGGPWGHGHRAAPAGTQRAELAGRYLLEQISGGKCLLLVFCGNLSLWQARGGFYHGRERWVGGWQSTPAWGG